MSRFVLMKSQGYRPFLIFSGISACPTTPIMAVFYASKPCKFSGIS